MQNQDVYTEEINGKIYVFTLDDSTIQIFEKPDGDQQ